MKNMFNKAMKKGLGLAFLVILIMGIIFSGIFFVSQEFVFSDYTIYDDFKTENTYSCQTSSYSKECSNSKWQWTTGSSGSPSEAINFDGLYLSTNVDTTSEIIMKQPLSLGNDFRWLLTTQFYCGHSKVWVEGENQFTELGGFGNKDWLVEYIADDLDSTKYAILVNGQLLSEVTKSSLQPTLRVRWKFSGETCRASGGDSLKVHRLEYRLPYNCPRGVNDVFATESFKGGATIDLYSTRYPVKSFCLDAPAIITSNEGIDSTASIYDKLKRGQQLSIPIDQTWTLFYYFDNSNNLIPNTCDYLKQWYDVDTSNCVAQTGIYHICSEGVWDNTLKGCLVEAPPIVQPGEVFYTCNGQLQKDSVCLGTPVIKYNCNGQLQDNNICQTQAETWYNCDGVLQQQQQCIQQSTPVYYCSGQLQSSSSCATNGTLELFYNCNGVITKESACIIYPPVEQVCKEGTINVETGTCIAPGKVVCPEGYDKKEIAADQFSCEKVGPLVITKEVMIEPEVKVEKSVEDKKEINSQLIWIVIIGLIIVGVVAYLMFKK